MAAPLNFPAFATAVSKCIAGLDAARAALAEINSIVTATVYNPSPVTAAPAVAATSDLTTFASRPGDPLPDTDPIPDRTKTTLAEWLVFLDDHSLKLMATKTATWPGEGDLIGYIMYRGGFAPNVAFAMATQWGPLYPPALTHCQTLRAIQQGVPADKDTGARWDAASRTWMDSTGRPYVAQTDFVSVVAR